LLEIGTIFRNQRPVGAKMFPKDVPHVPVGVRVTAATMAHDGPQRVPQLRIAQFAPRPLALP